MSPGFLLCAQGLRPQHLPGLAGCLVFSWDPTSPPGAASQTEMRLVAQVMKWNPRAKNRDPGRELGVPGPGCWPDPTVSEPVFLCVILVGLGTFLLESCSEWHLLMLQCNRVSSAPHFCHMLSEDHSGPRPVLGGRVLGLFMRTERFPCAAWKEHSGNDQLLPSQPPRQHALPRAVTRPSESCSPTGKGMVRHHLAPTVLEGWDVA